MNNFCLKARSENGYGFLRSRLKTGLGRGKWHFLVWNRKPGAQPHQKFSGVPFPLKSFQRSLPWCAWFEGHMKTRLWFKLSIPMHRDQIPRETLIIKSHPRDGEDVKCRGIWSIQSCPLCMNLSISSRDLFVKNGNPPAWRDFEKLSG